jgi:hypothetical protein
MISGQLAEISSVTFDGSFAWIGPEIEKCGANKYDLEKKLVNSSGLMCGLLVKKKKNLCLFVTIGIKKK